MKHADHWFYVPASTAQVVDFPEEEAVHAAKVLRLQVTDTIQWLDGSGGRYVGIIREISKRSLKAEVKSATKEGLPMPTVLAVGKLHDASRLEWLMEKATEVGVTEILLLHTERVERTRYKLSRLQAKVIAAVKQSGRAWVPSIKELTFEEGLMHCKTYDARFIAHCYEGLERNEAWDTVSVEKSACLFIGPEGDFTKKEVEEAETSGLLSISLGKARLRTETAALAALVRLRKLSV